MTRNWAVLATVAALALPACGGKKDDVQPEKGKPETGKTDPPEDPKPKFQAPMLEGLGDHSFAISSKNADAQKFFNQAFILAYGFNHAEAERSFREAVRLDPDCAICWWGAAWVLGPNINAAMEDDAIPKAWEALQNAVKLADKASDKEKALINALAKRYVETKPEKRDDLDKAFADAMAEVSAKFPDDLDIKSIYGEALMDMHPWNYWKPDGSPQEWTPGILKVFDEILAKDENHPGANHLYIHAVEASPEPEKGEPMADRLNTLVPGAGHLVHMPAHIYIRIGRYADGSEANRRAIASDQEYITQCRSQGIYPLAYHPHNYHFLFATTALEGRSAESIEAAVAVAGKVPEDKMREAGWGTLQHFWATPLYAWVRFGKWDDILAFAKPADDLLYPTGVWHYARGMAFRAKDELDKADAELAALEVIAANPALEKITIWDINPSSALMKIAVVVLEGELAAKRKKYRDAIKALTKAVEMEDALTYDEPPDWQIPTRLNLGTVQLEAGKPKDAEKTFRAELKKFPNNGWGLTGLVAALDAQGKKKEAGEAREQLETAWANADIELPGARF